MEIKTLKDLKLALNVYPDEMLEEFGAGWSPEFNEGDVSLLVYVDESEFEEKWDKVKEISSNIDDVGKWIENIGKVGHLIHEDEDYDGVGFEEMISSKDFK